MEIKKLPDAEFELMKIIWKNPSPISTLQIMGRLEEGDRRKPQTVLTLLARMTRRGFLKSERVGNERIYTPLVTQEEYLTFESSQFIRRFHDNSFISLVNTLYEGHTLTDKDIREIRDWLSEKE
jgi:predicted transcriptional regulator